MLLDFKVPLNLFYSTQVCCNAMCEKAKRHKVTANIFLEMAKNIGCLHLQILDHEN